MLCRLVTEYLYVGQNTLATILTTGFFETERWGSHEFFFYLLAVDCKDPRKMIIYSHHNILEVHGKYCAEDTPAYYKGLMSCLQQSSHKQGKVTFCSFS